MLPRDLPRFDPRVEVRQLIAHRSARDACGGHHTNKARPATPDAPALQRPRRQAHERRSLGGVDKAPTITRGGVHRADAAITGSS